MESKDLLSVSDLTRDEIQSLISKAIDLKAQGWTSMLNKKVVVLVFENQESCQKAQEKIFKADSQINNQMVDFLTIDNFY